MTSPVTNWRRQKNINANIGLIGEIISWTTIRVAPDNFSDQMPYPVVLVKLKNQNIIAQLVDWQPEHLRSGQKVICVVRRLFTPLADEIIPYGIKVRPLT